MGYRCNIYIGSDNGSRRIDRDYVDKVVEWANSTFSDGYTLISALGYYDGVREDSLVLNVLSRSEVNVRNEVGKLKGKLKQKAILVLKQPVDLTVI